MEGNAKHLYLHGRLPVLGKEFWALDFLGKELPKLYSHQATLVVPECDDADVNVGVFLVDYRSVVLWRWYVVQSGEEQTSFA